MYIFQNNRKDDYHQKIPVQTVFEVVDNNGNVDFVFTWCEYDEASQMFWVAFIGPKSLASNYNYTLQIQSKNGHHLILKDKYLFL